ncbi:lysophospholipid acyltransferase family protein [Spirochaeta dissipatitropha]
MFQLSVRRFSWLIQQIMRADLFFSRYRDINRKQAEDAMKNGGLLLVWHQNLWVVILQWRKSGYTALAGISREGQIIGQTLERMQWDVVRGSSTDNSVSSMRSIINLLKKQKIVAITPDGPSGPPYKTKLGPILMQQLTGVPIIPVGVHSTVNYTSRKAWDSSIVPLPFSRVTFYYGEPITGLAGMDREDAAELVNKAMEDASRKARWAR